MKVSLPKTKMREIAFLLLYAKDFTQTHEPEVVKLIADQLKISARHIHALTPYLDQISIKQKQIDQYIEESCVEYELVRIPKVELNILRLAVYELFFDDLIPEKVAISEGIRLARKFGNLECFRFVNGVLDAIYQKQLKYVQN